MSATTACLFFLSGIIGCSQNSSKGAYHHLLCVDEALVQSMKATTENTLCEPVEGNLTPDTDDESGVSCH